MIVKIIGNYQEMAEQKVTPRWKVSAQHAVSVEYTLCNSERVLCRVLFHLLCFSELSNYINQDPIWRGHKARTTDGPFSN